MGSPDLELCAGQTEKAPFAENEEVRCQEGFAAGQGGEQGLSLCGFRGKDVIQPQRPRQALLLLSWRQRWASPAWKLLRAAASWAPSQPSRAEVFTEGVVPYLGIWHWVLPS